MPTLILKSVFERSGIILERLGSPMQIGAHSKIQAASIPIYPRQLDSLASKTGVSGVLAPFQSKRHVN